MHRSLIRPFIIIFFLGCAPFIHAQQKLQYTIVKEAPHRTTSFTQGLYMADSLLYESSGRYRQSYFEIYDPGSNIQKKKLMLPSDVFAEGLTLVNDTLYILTWRSGRLLRFNATNLQALPDWTYEGEGWGLTHNDKHLIMSDGSHILSFRNPSSFAIEKRLEVKNSWRKFRNLNELEYVDGYIYSNIWQSPFIIKINAKTGGVDAIADFSKLVEINDRVKGQTVLNGIAYDPKEKAFWITGKLWSKRYLVRFEANNTLKKEANKEKP